MTESIGAGELRDRNIGRSARYSIISKVVTLAVQAVTFPLAVRALGGDRFALFAVLSASINWISLASIGIGPGLTVCLAEAIARGDEQAQRRLFTNSVLPAAVLAGILAALMLTAILALSPGRILGDVPPGLDGEARQGLILLVLLILFQVVIGVVEAAQAAYQETWALNRAMAIGNAFCFFVLVAVALYRPTVPMMVVAVSGVVVLARLVNAAWFIAGRRAILTLRPALLGLDTVRQIMRPGIAFTLVGIAAFSNNQVGLLIAARVVPRADVAVLAATLSLILLGVGIATMITAPLLPAVVDAAASGDAGWLRRTYSRVNQFALLYGLAAAIAISAAGALVINRWYGLPTPAGTLFFPLVGAYFAVLVWEYVHYHVLMGVGIVWPTTAIYLARSMLALVAAKPALEAFGIAGLAGALLASIVIGPLWLYPLLTARWLKQTHTPVPGTA
jgi:O-antigen/teichoic acid export membrane protein